MRLVIFAAALAATPAFAAPAAEPAAAVSPDAPIDAARLALATKSVDLAWPPGSYARLMREATTRLIDTMMGTLLDLNLAELAAAMPTKPGAEATSEQDKPDAPPAATANLSMRAMLKSVDPHFEERIRITNDTLMEAMMPLMTKVEPQVRQGMARAYARRFSNNQLQELNGFFATPTGRLYASEAMLLLIDPEIITPFLLSLPQFVAEMPAIMKKAEAATAHLPPPPKKAAEESKEGDDPEDSEDNEDSEDAEDVEDEGPDQDDSEAISDI